ncbi:MAG: VCBS repeat-containing protein [Rhodocyclaceae bacterium]|nr:VCBS repeat-containing protein [Rhodocyclaceae bacterium]MCA3054010.1 VCBS repeat-containing protein [Rhodocyclaceae bacterium]
MSPALVLAVTLLVCFQLGTAHAANPNLARRGGIDLDGNGRGAIVVRSLFGQTQAGKLSSNNVFQFSSLPDPGINFRLVGIGDFDGNGRSDLAFQNLNQFEFGEVTTWLDYNPARSRLLRNVKKVWDVQSVGDLDGDGLGDLVWRYVVTESPDTGVSYIWFGNGATSTTGTNVAQVRKRGGAPLTWTLLGAADINGDGAADMVYISPDGAIRVLVATSGRTCANFSAGSIPAGFTPLKFADYLGASRGEILLWNATTGQARLLALNATGLALPTYTGAPDDQNASCTGTTQAITTSSIELPTAPRGARFYASSDYDGDGRYDIVWLNLDGTLTLWLATTSPAIPTVVPNAGVAPSGFYAAFENGGVTAASASFRELPGRDVKRWLVDDVTSKLAFAGSWKSFEAASGLNVGIVGPFWNVVRLGNTQREGVALGGWMFNGSFQSSNPEVTPVPAAVFEQQSDGTLLDASSRLLGNTSTNGAGSVLVADFNGDGKDDLVYPAHNESPFLWKASTAWMSRADGSLQKITLPDAVMNHDAKVVTLDGRRKILSKSFGGSGNNGNGPGFVAIYDWNGSNFTIDLSLRDFAGGMSVLAGPFTGNSDNWLMIGGTLGGVPGVPFASTNPMLNFAYKFNGTLTLPAIPLPTPYFNGKAAFSRFISEWDPYSKTHTSRLWATDLNQDGLLDIMAGQEIWTSGPQGLQKSVFQLLVNRGNMSFTDETDKLAPEYSQDAYIDYNVRFVDVDGSGIDSIFMSPRPSYSATEDALKQGNYVLVNDGTGRLYAAMREEFRAMRTAVGDFLKTKFPSTAFIDSSYTQQFIAYRNAAGRLNFLALMPVDLQTSPGQFVRGTWGLASLSLDVNLATDFRRNLTVETRNGSKRIRTFAGDDVIKRAWDDPDCTIDGGLGVNTVVYPGRRADWALNKLGDTIQARPVGRSGGTDTLTRIQRAIFDDGILDLASL